MKTSNILSIGLLVIIGIAGLMFGVPRYNVWQQEMAGRARLAEATQSRQIAVEQARAEKEAAALRADAIEIMGEVAQRYPEYRYQEYLGAFADALRDGKINQIIYVPTETNIPIMEGGRTALSNIK